MQSQLEATLARLIAIPSVGSSSAACHEIIEYVQSEIAPFGLHIDGDFTSSNPWFVATTKNTKQPDILLATHLDIVPAPLELLAMEKRDGKLYGRGVFDMKFAAACYLEFIKANANLLSTLNIGFLFTTDEELGGFCTADILEAGWRPHIVFLPDGGDNWHIEKRAKGIYGAELTTHGRAAHGSRPWEGKNAIHMLMDILAELRQQYPPRSPSDATLSINVIGGGDAINQVADSASAFIDFRSFSKQDLSTYQQHLMTLAKKYDLDVRAVTAGEPVLFDPTIPAAQRFMQIFKEQTGQEDVLFCDSYGASDARYFARYDIPCIIVEPRGGDRHAAGEWLEAADLEKYYRLIERWLTEK